MNRLVKIICCIIGLVGCVHTVRANKPLLQIDKPSRGYTETISEMIKHGKTLLGKPYRYRGCKGWTMDCSGFVGYLFSRQGITLPRSSHEQFVHVERIQQPQPGDLLFFKGSNRRSSRVGHVAMVVSVEGDQIMMMHSSRSGIKVESYTGNYYYTSRYIGAGRVAELAKRSQVAPIEGNAEVVLQPIKITPEPITFEWDLPMFNTPSI